MAKEEEYFNPLDPLGPEFGKINQPIADTKGYTAFEGSRVMLPQPNMPVGNQIAYSNLPKLENLNAPNNQIYDNVVRTNINNPSIPQKAFDINEYNDSLKGYLDNMFQSNQDLNDYARIYSYDAGSTNLSTFYKRYSAYGQEKFDEVGFSPLRDNDANFNARTTRWDDFSRMMSNSFVPLFTQGFTSGFKSFGKILRGDFTSSDREDAEVYETAAAIGQSTKGGIGGFMNNAAMNFSYTAGIITEAIAEETLGAILAAPTGGSSLFTTTVNNARKLPSLLKGVKTGYQGVRQTLNLTKEISGARKVYNAIKESQFLKGTLNQLNPLNNTMGALKQIRQADNFTNLGKIYKTAGGLYRDSRNINMALSEARLEGGMVQNKIYDELYREAYKANGNKVPSDKELAEISKQAEQGGYETLLENVGIIYATNAITFNNITGPRGGLRNFIKSTTDDIYEIASREGSKNFGKIGKVIYNRTSKAFELEANNLKTWAKGWLKNPIHKSVGKTVGYFKANFSEGIQENLQETIAQANEKYFMDSYNSPTLKSMLYSRAAIKGINKGRLDYFSDAWAQQNPFTAQGFETFASGFAMGTMAGPLNSAVPFLSRTYNRMFNKEEYTRWKEAQTTVAQNLVNELNNTNLETFLNGYTQNLGVQEKVAATKQKGTKKEALDAETEAYISQVQLLKRTGTFGIFSEKLKDLHNLTDDEFAEAVGIEKDQVNKYRARVDSSIERLNKIKNLYERVERKNPNPINVSDLKEDDPEYQDKLILYHAWETVNRNIVFFNETYDDILHRRSEINKKYNNNKKLKNISNRKRNLLFNPIRPFNETKEAIDGVGVPTGDMLEEINLLEKELALEKETTKNPAKIQMLQEQINLTKDYAEQYRALDIFQRREEYVGLIKEKLKAETGTEYTDEQVLKFMEDEFGAVNDTQKRDELLKNLRNSYTNYLKTHAKQNGQEIFNEDIDETWELMKDYYDLDIEKTKISKYVDVLNDPMAFLEAVRRNNDWLKKVTAKKIEYYEKIIREEMDNIRANALLNALANKGLFISTEDMLNYFADGVPPTEIYDDINKKIYPIGSKEYSQIYQDYFKKYEELKEDLNPNKSEIIDEAYQQQINALEKEKQEKIDALPKEDVETQINNLEGKISLKSLSQEIQNDQYAELTVLQAKPTTKTTPISDDKADISEGEAVSVHTPRKLFKGRLERIKENQEGKRRAQHSVSGDGYVVSLKQDDFNETDEQGRPMGAGAEVYLNEDEVAEIKKIEQKAKMKLIDNVQKNEALQQVYRDVFKRALDTYEVVDDANFETSVEARRNNYKAETTPTATVIEAKKAEIERRRQEELNNLGQTKILKLGKITEELTNSKLPSNVEVGQLLSFNWGGNVVQVIVTEIDSNGNIISAFTYGGWSINNQKQVIENGSITSLNSAKEANQNQIESVVKDKINAKYDAELDALEGNTSELEKITVYKDKVGQLRLKNEEGDILDSEDTTQRYSSARIYTIDKVSDPAEIEKITNFYNDKIEEVKEAYVASKENMELEIPYEDVTPESNLDTPDLSEFKEELYNNYQKEYVNKLSPSEKNALLEDEDLNNKTFEEWYSRPENKKYFDEYNNANRPLLSKQETIMNIRGVEVNTNTKTLEQLIAYRDDVNNQITSNNEEINFLDPETEKEQIKKYEEKNKELSLNLKNLNNIISARQFANFPEEIKSAVRSIQKIFKAQSKVEKGVELTEDDEVTGLKKGQKAYRINGKFHRRTTQAIQDVIDETYEYQGQEEVDTIFKQTIAKKGLNPASIKEFVDRLRSLPDTGEAALPGTNDIFFNKLQQELNALPNMTAEQIELERQKNEILTKANKEKNLAKQQALFDQAEEIQNKIDGVTTAPVSDMEAKKADIEKKYAGELRGQIRARLRNEGKSEDEINKLTGTSESPIITSLMPQDVISLINSYKNSKAKQLENYNKYKDKYKPNEEVVPEIGEIISNDTSFWDNKIEELAALEGTAQPTTKDNFDTATKKNTTKNIIDAFFGENTYEDSRVAGNFFDLAKDYLESGKKPEFNEEIITREAYDSLIEYLDTIKKRVDSGELYIVGRDLIVYDSDIVHQDGKKDRIAGEIDLILVDKDGIYVVDIKSGETNKFLNFNNLSTTNKKFTKRNEYTLQTAAYATMLEKMIDRKVAGIAMLPIQRESNKKTNQVIEAGKPLSGQFFNELEYKVDEDGKIVVNKKIDPKTKKPFNEKQFTITGNKYKFDFLVPLYRESVQEEMDKLFPKKLGELEPGGKRAIANRINNIRERLSEITDELSDINVKNLAIIKVLIDNAVKQNISIPKDIIEQYESKNKNLKQYTSKEKIKSVIDKYKKNLNSSEKNLKEQSDKLRKIKSNVSFDNVDKSIFNEQSDFIKEQLESDSNFKYYFDQHNSFYKNAVDRSPTDNQIVAIETMKESGLLTDADISDADIKYLSMAEASELIHEGVKRIQYLKTSSVEKSKDFREYQKNIFDLMKATKINSNDVSLVQLFEDAEKISKTGRTKQAIDLLNIKLNNLNSEYNKEFTSDVRKTKILKEILDIEQFKEALIDTYEMPIDIVEQVQESEIVEEFIDEFDTDINVGDIVYSRKKNNNTPYKVKEKTKDSYVLSPPRGKAITVKIDNFADNYITKIEMDSGNITPPTVEVTDTEKEILNESQVTVNNFLQNQDSKTKAYEKGIKNTPEENRKNLLNKTKNCL